MLTSQRNRRYGFTAVEAVVVFIVLAIVVTVVMVQVDKRTQARLREESAANLNAVYATFIGRRNISDPVKAKIGSGQEWAVMWHPLSSSPGQLSPERTNELMQNIQRTDSLTAFISPAHPNAEQMRMKAQTEPTSAITDDSFWYLGYELQTEEAGLLFVEAYKKAVAKTGEPPKAEVLKVGLHNSAYGVETDEISRLSHYNFFLSRNSVLLDALSVAMSTGNQRDASTAPAFIERPGLQRGGSHVLWSDGTVEFIPYPGKWPMTEKFIKALESLDELKVKQ